jgi:hypothetical protein
MRAYRLVLERVPPLFRSEVMLQKKWLEKTDPAVGGTLHIQSVSIRIINRDEITATV